MNGSECLLFHQLSQNVPYHAIETAKGTLCLAGAIRVSVLWKRYGVRFLVHENTKTLFRFFFALNIIVGTLFGSSSLFELIRLRFDCFLLDFRLILITRGFAISTVIAAQHVMLVVSFERLYSTIFPEHFEKSSSQLLSASLALTAIIGTYAYCMKIFSLDFELFSCEMNVALISVNIPQNSARYAVSLARQVGMFNCIGLIVLSIDMYLNFFRKRKTETSLAISYQRSENRRILLTLLPIELTQTIVLIFTTFSLTAYLKLASNPTPIEKHIFTESVTLTTYLPLILSFIIKYNVDKNMNRPPPVDPQLDHFEALRRSWNA